MRTWSRHGRPQQKTNSAPNSHSVWRSRSSGMPHTTTCVARATKYTVTASQRHRGVNNGATSARTRSDGRTGSLAQDRDAAGRDRVVLGVGLRVDTDLRSWRDDDVLVEDRAADDGAAP